jgi:hypothetical protein
MPTILEFGNSQQGKAVYAIAPALSVEILATMQNCSALQALAYLLNFDKNREED